MTLKKYVINVKHKSMAYFRSLPVETQQKWRQHQLNINRQECVQRAARERKWREQYERDKQMEYDWAIMAGIPWDHKTDEPIGVGHSCLY